MSAVTRGRPARGVPRVPQGLAGRSASDSEKEARLSRAKV